MRILVCGDVMGRSGRESIAKYVPELRKKLSLDFVMINVDNAAHGFGITENMVHEFLENGADVLTGGNHLFDQKEATAILEKEKRLLRPANMPAFTAGNGVLEVITQNGQKVVAVHLLGQKNMPIIGENPFGYMRNLLTKYNIGKNVQAIVVDFHAEVTSEKNAFGHFLDGKVSVVAGTHTHVPTADERILEYGTAFQTDVGMCGDYNSVIGMQKQAIVDRFVKGYSNTKFSPAAGEATFSALFVETDDSTGLATNVKAIRLGGSLNSAVI